MKLDTITQLEAPRKIVYLFPGKGQTRFNRAVVGIDLGKSLHDVLLYDLPDLRFRCLARVELIGLGIKDNCDTFSLGKSYYAN
jgi:hypothetical protein